jgi:hypothetical protein
MIKILTSFFIITLFFANSARAVDDPTRNAVVKSFEPIVERIGSFFSKSPKLLTKVSNPEDPTQQAFSITHFRMDKITYDIFTSNSIIKPYTGYIDVDTEVADNKPCGDQSFVKDQKEGWSNVDEAISNANAKSCFVVRTPQTGVIRNRFVFNYYLKTGRWVLSEIIYPDGSINGRLMALLGVPSPWFPVIKEPQALSYDRAWFQLFSGL